MQLIPGKKARYRFSKFSANVIEMLLQSGREEQGAQTAVYYS